MTPTDPIQPDTIVSPEPVPGSRFRRRNLLVGLASVAVLAAAATGVAMASTSTPTPSPSGSPSAPGAGPQQHEGGPGPGGPGGYGRGPGGMRGGIGGIGGAMGALHGVFTVPKQGGGYQTLAVQRGTVTAVSATSLAVKSADGFTATYAVPADTLVNAARDGIGSVKKGDEVNVVAQQKSGNDTALQIGDLTRWQGMADKFGPGRDRGTAPKAPASPTPGSTGTTGSSAFGV